MKKSYIWSLAMVAFVMALGVVVLLLSDISHAACGTNYLSIQTGAQCAKGSEQASSLLGDGGFFQSISNLLLFLVGALAVIMLIIGGLRYIISGGNQTQVTAAKNTILYAIVGIIIAFLAYAAIDFVIGFLATA